MSECECASIVTGKCKSCIDDMFIEKQTQEIAALKKEAEEKDEEITRHKVTITRLNETWKKDMDLVPNLKAKLRCAVEALEDSHFQDCAYEDDSENEAACDCGMDKLIVSLKQGEKP